MDHKKTVEPGIPVSIYWFSGTGNSLIIALECMRYFKDHGHPVTCFPIESTDPQSVKGQGLTGFVVPVAGQSTYPFIWEFFEKLSEADGTPCFFADTMAMYSGGILGPLKTLLKRKGYHPIAAREFIMPNNLFRKKGRPEMEQALIKKSKTGTRIFCEQMVQGKGSWWDIPGYSRIMSCWYRYRPMVNAFKKIVDYQIDPERCTRCGICIKLCPENSLILSDHHSVPVRTETCSLCHRCFAYCPEEAVRIGRKDHFRYRSLSLPELTVHLERSESDPA